MEVTLVKTETAQERKLRERQGELSALQAELAQQELDLATLQAVLHTIEERYLRVTASRFARIDELQAQIAELRSKQKPHDPVTRARASKARARAEESRKTAGAAEERPERPKFTPTEDLRKLYRKIAKIIHPDLTTDPEERVRRQRLMAEANRAYEDGDEERLVAIAAEWEASKDDNGRWGVAAELARIVREIAQVRQRLQAIADEIAALLRSRLNELRGHVEAAEAERRDYFAELADSLDRQIAELEAQHTEMCRTEATS